MNAIKINAALLKMLGLSNDSADLVSERIAELGAENRKLKNVAIEAGACLQWIYKADIDGAFKHCALPQGARKAANAVQRALNDAGLKGY